LASGRRFQPRETYIDECFVNEAYRNGAKGQGSHMANLLKGLTGGKLLAFIGKLDQGDMPAEVAQAVLDCQEPEIIHRAVAAFCREIIKAEATPFIAGMSPSNWEVLNTDIDLTDIDVVLDLRGYRPASQDEILKWGKEYWDGKSDVVTISCLTFALCRLWHLRCGRINPCLDPDSVRVSAPWPKTRWLLVVRK
jgi:hypothetical protein